MIELLAALLLLSAQAAIGAPLVVCVMFGAIIAHVTVLGFEVGSDRGLLVMMLGVVLVAAATVLVARRRELPFVGSTLGDGGSGAAPEVGPYFLLSPNPPRSRGTRSGT